MTPRAASAARPAAIRRSMDIATVAAFSALTIALGALYIPLPFTPVPVTGQTLGVVLAGNVLGPRRATASVLLVLMLVAAGLPVLAGGRGGAGVFLGPTGGFLVGWITAAFLVGLATRRLGLGRAALALRIGASIVFGVFGVYLTGVPWFAIATGRDLWEAMAAGMAPFLPGDIFKAVAAALIAQALLLSQVPGIGNRREAVSQ